MNSRSFVFVALAIAPFVATIACGAGQTNTGGKPDDSSSINTGGKPSDPGSVTSGKPNDPSSINTSGKPDPSKMNALPDPTGGAVNTGGGPNMLKKDGGASGK